MARLKIELARAPKDLRPGLAEIVAGRKADFGRGKDARPVSFIREERGGESHLSVRTLAGKIVVRYSRPSDAFRAVGRLLAHKGKTIPEFTESSPFQTLGIMVDVSRNGVIDIEPAKALMRRIALMGLNMMMLYSEDTYEVPGEPFFGYLRGRYTKKDLEELDKYAAALGIEMVPCIQTLAHLEQILQWPAYDDMRDIGGCLVAEEDRTYELITKMITAAAAPFSTGRMHIGMDEAWGLGKGAYRDRHGEKSGFDILNDHLMKVRGICESLGVKPMIWSDMYFRLTSEGGEYYDGKTEVPREVIERIPSGVDFVYWDYYAHEVSHYEDWIDRHRMLGHEPIMAGGVWTWDHFWTALPHSLSATDCCMKACKSKGLREVFMTMWGDDGMEIDLFSALPGLQFFADHGYSSGPDVDRDAVAANLRGTCGMELDDYIAASYIDIPPAVKEPEKVAHNIGKWLLWQDPLLAVMDPDIGKCDLKKHYSQLAKKLDAAARKKNAGASRLKFPAQIARVLAIKGDLRSRMAAAYKKKDKKALAAIRTKDLTALIRETKKLLKIHRELWLSLYRPFGLEVVEGRYGGLIARLESTKERLGDYLAGKVESIPELEVKLESIFGQLRTVRHGRVATPSAIK